VPSRDTAIEPRQPRRFEKSRNMANRTSQPPYLR
jgi:hypothetical protein